MQRIEPDHFFSAARAWHLPAIGQLAQPHPQEERPFFLLRISEKTIAKTAAASARRIATVNRLSLIQTNNFVLLSMMRKPPPRDRNGGSVLYLMRTFWVSVVASRYFLKNSMYTNSPSTRIAAIRPITLMLPVKMQPN